MRLFLFFWRDDVSFIRFPSAFAHAGFPHFASQIFQFGRSMKRLFSLLAFLFLLCAPALYAFADDEDLSGSDGASDEAGTDGEGVVSDSEAQVEVKPEHVSSVSIYARDKIVRARLQTSVGEIVCDLYAGTHPLTVLNFVSLSKGKPAWTDANGQVMHEPYYKNLPFAGRSSGTYAMSGLRPEGTNFVIADERCESHTMDAGAIAMVQPYPGMASAQFILLAKRVPAFKGMYPVFGKCGPLQLIDELSRKDAVLEQIVIEE